MISLLEYILVGDLMKKYLPLIIVFIFLTLTGCTNNSEIEIFSNISQNNSEFISINYPKTGIKKLDKNIEQNVNKTINTFYSINSEEKELNIDYTYNVINENYINISLINYISYNNYQKEDIYTYVFNKNKNQLMNVSDIINISDELQETITNKFIFDEEYITFFSIKNNEIVENKIKLDSNNLKININKNKDTKKETYEIVHNVIDTNKPIIALTFDDGPSKYTKDIIELLKEYDCNATFFVLGNKVSIYKDTLKYAITLGNEIGNHTYNHKWLSRLDTNNIKEQINKTQNIIKEELNYTPVLLRPTYGSVNKKIRNNTNLEIVLWNVDTLDWKINNSKKIAERALNKIKDGSIILMHDTHKRTYEALKIMIPKLIEDGYQFVTVSELNKIKELKKYQYE